MPLRPAAHDRAMTRPTLRTGVLPHALCRVAAVLLATTSTVPPAAALGAAPPPGPWVRPLDGSQVQVVRGFEPPGRRWLTGHRGVDLAATAGSTVRTAGAGVVTYAGDVAGRGVVVVSHGELRTTYEPVTAHVPSGGRVEAGQAIGTLDAAGSHCAPHACLHWGLLAGDTYLDPFGLLAGRAVRLLPLGPGSVRAEPSPDVDPAPAARSVHGAGGDTTVGPMLAAAAAAGIR
jgi:murein DD-endopeptidase MepM/ murein hydrolase activator NlpD